MIWLTLIQMYATDVRQTERQTDGRQTAPPLNAPPIRGGGIIRDRGQTEHDLVAFYDIRPRNGSGLFSDTQSRNHSNRVCWNC